MKIRRVDLIQLRLPIAEPFETSYSRIHEFDRLILKCYTSDFAVYSECAAWPDLGYSYETDGTAKEVLKNYFLKALLGTQLSGPEDFWRLCGRFRGHPMAKAAVENALWTLKALEENKPLAEVLGGQRKKIQAGVSIGIQENPKELIKRISQFLALGYTNIKMKIKPGVDISYIREIRREYPEVPLRVDANNAYQVGDFPTLKALDEFNLMALEQPLDYEDIPNHARLQAQIKNPICLDESIQSLSLARIALEMKACRIVNIKQCRLGGLTRAIEVHDLCQQGGIGVWCGGMYETGIGRAVLLALSSLPNFIYPTDTSASNRYFRPDIVESEFTLNPDGTLDVPQRPGLGVEVSEKRVEDYMVGREIIRE